MAKRAPRPGRTLLIFLAAVGIVFGLVGIGGQWKPELGLDLQGGTRITLIAKGDPTPENLAEAAGIIDQRVNGSGVSEAEVTTQGKNQIVVEIPGETRQDLVEVVQRQAQMRFRLVARRDDGATPTTLPEEAPGAGVTAPPTAAPSVTGSQAPSGEVSPSTAPSSAPSAAPSSSSSPVNRPAPAFADESESASPTASPTASPSAGDSASPVAESESPSAEPSAAPSESPAAEPSAPAEPQSRQELIDDPLAWVDNPDQQSLAAFEAYQCPPAGEAPVVKDNPNMPLVTCDANGIKYLLSKAVIEGTQLEDASAGIPQQQAEWVVNLSLDSKGADTMREVSQAFINTGQQFAIVLDGLVLSAPGFDAVINDGNAQISGSFTQQSATDLATSLKFGSLPIAFEKDTSSEEIGPSLAGNQLQAGLWAGAIGLVLVMLYCLFYYRGLGLVVIASLIVAGALTYGLVLLLAKTAGFTLTLPGIAGLIVAVGVTADSFIVFFERIRDEMREGRSMRVAVENGWVRARNTCLAADAVSLLAAIVLYIFAAGVVKGFAFALGVSTLIDLAVFFWFTKPMVSWLGQFAFFNRGHKLSGLYAEDLGVSSLPGLRTGGKA